MPLTIEHRGIELVGSASALPLDLPEGSGREWTNAEFFDDLSSSDANVTSQTRGWSTDEPWIRYGVRRRQWLSGARHSGDLALEAARRALADAHLAPGDLDLLVVATSTPPRITSSLAGYIAHKCDLRTAAFDVRAGGAAALVAWITAAQFLSDDIETALIVAAETPSLFHNRNAPLEASLLGDGAGAIVLRRSRPSLATGGLLGGFIETLAAPGTPWTVPGPLPPTFEAVRSRAYEFQPGDADYNKFVRELRTETVSAFRSALPQVAGRARYFVSNAPTAGQAQAEYAALANGATGLVSPLAEHGYVGCAGPLIAIHELRVGNALRRGDVIVTSAVGGGVHRSWLAWEI